MFVLLSLMLVLSIFILFYKRLDYVFGVPLARGYRRIHTNVNMSYYNYSNEEEDFSRQIIRYWANFIKTGNPNKDSLSSSSKQNPNTEWKSYTNIEHNYIFFQLNNIHNERNYFDSMYSFWLKCFQIELNGGCINDLIIMKMKKHLLPFLLILLVLVIIIIIYFICKHYQNKERYHIPNDSLQYPDFVTT